MASCPSDSRRAPPLASLVRSVPEPGRALVGRRTWCWEFRLLNEYGMLGGFHSHGGTPKWMVLWGKIHLYKGFMMVNDVDIGINRIKYRDKWWDYIWDNGDELLTIFGGFHKWGIPITGWFISWKIPSFEMDENWGYLYDSGHLHFMGNLTNLTHSHMNKEHHEHCAVSGVSCAKMVIDLVGTWNHLIWRFPEMGVPPVIIHFNQIFHFINQPAIKR